MRHLSRHELHAHKALASYAETLQEDRRVLLHRYRFQDIAFKTVGVGSVGTYCAIALLVSDGGAPLLLRIKEAQESVLARFAGSSTYANHGERVVVGQRMLQAATDIFLGWPQIPLDGRYFYVRRLKDQRLANIGARLAAALPFYADLCGRTLARAHARAGDAVAISAYIGKGPNSTKPSPNSRWPTPIRPSATGALCSTPSRPGGSSPRSRHRSEDPPFAVRSQAQREWIVEVIPVGNCPERYSGHLFHGNAAGQEEFKAAHHAELGQPASTGARF